jgi:hypothetical protein
LQIVQIKEEQYTPPEQVTAAVYIPPGIIEDKEEKGCCKDGLRRIMCMSRKKVPHQLEEINLLP